MPYDQDYFCLIAGCAPSDNEFFLASVGSVAEATARRFTFGDIGNPTIQPTWTPTWDIPGLTLKFPARTQLIVEGSLAMDGITLTEKYRGDGWYGVLYEPNGGGYVRGVTIEKFGHSFVGPGAIAPQVCGLTVNDRWLAVYRSTIQGGINGAHGVCSMGPQAQVALRAEGIDRTIVQNNGGDGLRVWGAGRILADNILVDGNHGNGGSAVNTNSGIRAVNSTFSNNFKVGLAAYSNGYVILNDPAVPGSLGRNTLDRNFGGGILATGQGSYVNAGTYTGSVCSDACENEVTGHLDVSAPYEVKAASGSTVYVEYDFWGEGRTFFDLELDVDASSLIFVLPLWDGNSAKAPGPLALGDGPGDGSNARGTEIRDRVDHAFGLAAQNLWVPAFASLQAALALAGSTDEERLVLGAVAALAGLSDAPDVPAGLLRAIEAHLGRGGDARAQAMRALLSVNRIRGRSADARTLAVALRDEYPATDHALTGLANEVDLSLDAGDIPAAQAALATMVVAFPDALLTETAHASFVLVAGEEALPVQGFVPPAALAATGMVDKAAAGFVLHAAYPNLFNPQSLIRFSVATTSRVEIAVYDLIGREVATLTDGVYEQGAYEVVFDGTDLASGMYLLRANVAENGGAGRAFTQRLTLLK